MRVGIDVSPLDQTRAGTARHLRQLEGLSGIDVVRLRRAGSGRLATLYRDAVWYPVVLPRLARRERLDVLHCPTFRGPVTRPACPLVVTIHDLAVLRHPAAFNAWTRWYSRASVPRVVRAATRLVAVSEFTKREATELLGVAAERITVVPNGVADVFRPDGEAAEGDYVLAVGTLEPRKNLGRAEEAARLAGVELRVVGARGWGGVTASGWLGPVSDEELARLYRGARCLVYPSLYEGFGLPIAEAMACGTPVVTSAGGATEETAGGAAVLVDPYDAVSIAEGIDEVTRRSDELRRLGLERARSFGLEAVVKATVDVYLEAAAA